MISRSSCRGHGKVHVRARWSAAVSQTSAELMSPDRGDSSWRSPVCLNYFRAICACVRPLSSSIWWDRDTAPMRLAIPGEHKVALAVVVRARARAFARLAWPGCTAVQRLLVRAARAEARPRPAVPTAQDRAARTFRNRRAPGAAVGGRGSSGRGGGAASTAVEESADGGRPFPDIIPGGGLVIVRRQRRLPVVGRLKLYFNLCPEGVGDGPINHCTAKVGDHELKLTIHDRAGMPRHAIL